MAEIVTVHGLRELREALTRTLPEALQGQAMDGSLAKGAALIVREARSRAPKREGVLRRAIHQMRSRLSTRTRPSRIIRVRHGKRQQKRNRDAFYWRWIEFGRGIVTAKRTASLGTPQDGFFGKEVRATPAQPFMRPAFEAKKHEAIEAIRQSLAGEIRKVAARAARRSQALLSRFLRRQATGV